MNGRGTCYSPVFDYSQVTPCSKANRSFFKLEFLSFCVTSPLSCLFEALIMSLVIPHTAKFVTASESEDGDGLGQDGPSSWTWSHARWSRQVATLTSQQHPWGSRLSEEEQPAAGRSQLVEMQD